MKSMNCLEYFSYSLLFLCNKYIGISCTENTLHWFENKMICKYVPRKELLPMNIPTIEADQLTGKLFYELSNNFRNPVLIKGFLKDTKAVNEWDIDYLEKIVGDFNVNILRIKETQNIKVESIAFNEFTKEMKTENVYLNNNSTIFQNFPILFNDIQEKFYQFINLVHSNLRNIYISNLFIGYNEKDNVVGSNMHAGGVGNFFCMIHGKKHWTLINPQYSCLLKGRVSQKATHAQTLFDMPDTKLSIIPKMLKHFPRYDITLAPGDILWNAPWWWHRIENSEGLSIGIAIRNNKVTTLNLLNNITYTLSGTTYLVYNTFILSLYEKFIRKDKHFFVSDDNKKSNVLHQIEKLIEKYPKTITYDEVITKSTSINMNLKDK